MKTKETLFAIAFALTATVHFAKATTINHLHADDHHFAVAANHHFAHAAKWEQHFQKEFNFKEGGYKPLNGHFITQIAKDTDRPDTFTDTKPFPSHLRKEWLKT